jgi:hypothetical protein
LHLPPTPLPPGETKRGVVDRTPHYKDPGRQAEKENAGPAEMNGHNGKKASPHSPDLAMVPIR